MIGIKMKLDTTGIDALNSLTAQRNVTLKAVRAGIKILVPLARAAAPRRKGSGALRQAQGFKAAKGKKGKTLSFAVQGARVGFEKMTKAGGYKTPKRVVPAFYDHLVQGGTKPHRLGKGESVGRLAVGRRRARPATAQVKGGKHPGTKPNPYRKRVYERAKGQVGSEVARVMALEIQNAIEKQSAKLAGQ